MVFGYYDYLWLGRLSYEVYWRSLNTVYGKSACLNTYGGIYQINISIIEINSSKIIQLFYYKN
jgi:hypothetical protein